MNKHIRIGLLTELKSPILGYILKSLIESGIKIDALFLDSKISGENEDKIWNDRTRGSLPLIPLHQFENSQIPSYFVKNHSSSESVHLVKSLNIDLLINAGTPRILKRDMLNAPTIGILNCHPGILPDFRGCTCFEWAVYLDKEAGNSVHLMTGEIDEGPLVLMESISFKKTDDYSAMRVKIYKHGFDLMARSVQQIINKGDNAFDRNYTIGGQYHTVIGDDEMKEVLRKIELGKYAYQY
jgi:folate-dependent phosphoribosylglycinamide formyltransferase PurN